MDLGGLSLNIMTLGGLAVGVGMLVDSTIVMLENIYRHQTEGEDSFEAGTHAAREVNSAIVASTSTNLAAIIPFLFIGGLIGLFFRELIFTITAAIIAAMIVALTLVPALATRLKENPQTSRYNGMNRFMQFLQQKYRNSVHFVINNLIAMIILIAALLIAIGFSWPAFDSESRVFLPEMDDGRVGIRISADPGVKLDVTDEAVNRIESLIQKMPHVETMFTITGGFIFGRTEVEARNKARIDVQLSPKVQRSLSSDDWIVQFKERLQKHKTPGVRVFTSKLRIPGTYFHRGSDDISLQVSGPDIDILEQIGYALIEQLRPIKGLGNIEHSSDETGQELSISIDRERAIDLGFNVEQIGRIIRTAIEGEIASDYLEGDRSYNIRVRLPDINTSSLSDLESLLLGKVAGNQSSIYLADVAQIQLLQAPASILRDNQQRIIKVTARINEGYTSGQVLEAVSQTLQDFELPDGYQIYDAGISDILDSSQNTVWQLLGMALFLVLVVMAVQYESLRNPLIIMLGVPFAAIGVAIAINWAELPLSMPLWLGMIMLAGIVVNNAIVMVEYIEILRKQSRSLEDAIAEAAGLRLRPILMTSLTTIIGLTPLAIGLGEGAEMLEPLALTIISGLTFSLIVSLYLIPVLYRVFHSQEKALA
jgi:multidrug efflux pump subunit AcrB